MSMNTVIKIQNQITHRKIEDRPENVQERIIDRFLSLVVRPFFVAPPFLDSHPTVSRPQVTCYHLPVVST